jgi:hypothetical protein
MRNDFIEKTEMFEKKITQIEEQLANKTKTDLVDDSNNNGTPYWFRPQYETENAMRILESEINHIKRQIEICKFEKYGKISLLSDCKEKIWKPGLEILVNCQTLKSHLMIMMMTFLLLKKIVLMLKNLMTLKIFMFQLNHHLM